MVSTRSRGQKVFNVCNIIALILLSAIFILPYIIVISSSLTDEMTLIVNGYSVLPKNVTLYAYQFMFSKNLPILGSLWNSVKLVLISTVLCTTTCMLYAYALQHRSLKFRKFFNLYVVITMLFGGGLVPYYLVVSYFFEDSIWALIIPGLMAAWYTFLIRNYFVTIPVSLCEAAEIDGARHFRILFSVYVPLSTPVIATIALFVAVSQWNSYSGPMLFIDSSEKYPIQLTLQKLLDNVENMVSVGNTDMVPTESVKMAAIVVATLPIICVYPFLQRFFINGMILGGVKE